MTYLRKWKNKVWMLGVAVGAVCLAIGTYSGQFDDIYRKAVTICLECIGIG